VDDFQVFCSIEPSLWLLFDWNELGELAFDDGCMAHRIYIQEWIKELRLSLLVPSSFGFVTKQILLLERSILIHGSDGNVRKFIRWKRLTRLKDLVSSRK
jgi:hypothetical protein